MTAPDETPPHQRYGLTAGATVHKLAALEPREGRGDDHPGSRDGRRRLRLRVGRRDRDRRTWASGRIRWGRGRVRAGDRRRRTGRAALVAITIWAVAAATPAVPRAGPPRPGR